MQEYKLGKYKFIFPKETKFKIDDCDCYLAITFFIEGNGFLDNEYSKYEVINNYHMGYRLCISSKEGCCDIPFKKHTFTFLHPSIIIEEE